MLAENKLLKRHLHFVSKQSFSDPRSIVEKFKGLNDESAIVILILFFFLLIEIFLHL